MVTASCSGSTDASDPGSHHGTSSGADGRAGAPAESWRPGTAPSRGACPTAPSGMWSTSSSRAAARGSVPAHLALLLLRERHGAQAEQLVDLEGVEERGLALRRQLRVVVEDDRRAEHHARLVVRPGEHREDPVVLARRDERHRPLAAGRAATRTTRRPPRAAGDRRPERGAATAAGSSPGWPRAGAVLDAQGQQGDGVRRARVARSRSSPAARAARRCGPACPRATFSTSLRRRRRQARTSPACRAGPRGLAPPRRPRPMARRRCHRRRAGRQ